MTHEILFFGAKLQFSYVGVGAFRPKKWKESKNPCLTDFEGDHIHDLLIG
jgi:hypothetical protein